MAKSVKYDAFISYRHCEPDSDIAAKLQKKLEGFRLPKDIANKIGRTRLNRVFRDETEFAVSDDLTQAIEEAIANSDYLIAICSPEYLKSSWCQKEIQSFIKYHDRKHILLVLADGEPDNAFPQDVISDERYTVGPDGRPHLTKVTREPLAADCRGADAKERNPKIDKAVMRLIASILGIRFDDLQQRHRQEQYKRTRNRVLVAFGILAAFLAVSIGFLIWIAAQNIEITRQNEEIARQNEIITLKYADTLAATSDNLLRDGKRMDAVYAARLALSDEKTDNYSELATKALANSLGIYDLPNSFSCDSDILLPSSVLDDLVVSANGSYASFKDLDRVRYVVDMNTGNTVMSFEENDFEKFAFDGDNGFVFKRRDDNYAYYDLATGTETDLGVYDVYLDSNPEGDGYILRSGDDVTLYKGTDSIWTINARHEGFQDVGSLDFLVRFLNDDNECFIFVTDYDYQMTYAYIINMTSGSSNRITVASWMCFGAVTDGKSIVWYEPSATFDTVYLMDIDSGTTRSMTVDDTCYMLAVADNDVVVVTWSNILVLNKDLEEITRADCGDYIRLYVSGDAIYLVDSTCRLYRVKNGACDCYDTVPTDTTFSWLQMFRNGKLYAAVPGDNHIYTYSFRQSDYMTVATGDFETLEFDYYEMDEIYNNRETGDFVDLIMENETEFEDERIFRAVMCENADMGLVQLFDGAVHIYDSETGEKLKTIYSIDGSVNRFYYDERNGYYYISSNNVDVYDEDLKNIYSIRDCVMVGIDKHSDAIVVYNNTGETGSYYMVCPVTYDELISIADEYLDGYEPDERVKEKYSLG